MAGLAHTGLTTSISTAMYVSQFILQSNIIQLCMKSFQPWSPFHILLEMTCVSTTGDSKHTFSGYCVRDATEEEQLVYLFTAQPNKLWIERIY